MTIFQLLAMAILMYAEGVNQVDPCAPAPGRVNAMFSGEVSAGNQYEKTFGRGWTFRLIQNYGEWSISVVDGKSSFNLTDMTPPIHGPNDTVISGWQFRNTSNNGKSTDEQSARNRAFIFSPAVPNLIQSGKISPEAVREVEKFGKGFLQILDYGLANTNVGEKPNIVWLRFRVCLSWPSVLDSSDYETK